MSNTREEPAQPWTIQENCSFWARFLTAIASNAEAVVVFRWLGIVTSAPINSLWFDRTHCNTGTTNSAFLSINEWSLGDSIFNESSKSPTRTVHWWFSIYFKTFQLNHRFVIQDHLTKFLCILHFQMNCYTCYSTMRSSRCLCGGNKEVFCYVVNFVYILATDYTNFFLCPILRTVS